MKYTALLTISSIAFCFPAFGQGSGAKPQTNLLRAETPSKFEREVLKEINTARTLPKKYVEKLTHRKSFMDGKILRRPKRKGLITFEGIPAIDEAITDLKGTSGLSELNFSNKLTKVARNQLKDIQDTPSLGHFGKDGSNLDQRISKYGKTGKAGENISRGDITPEEVALSMLIDDGVKSRQHRRNILSSEFTLFGAACGKGKGSRLICVVVFADKFAKPKKKSKSVLDSAASTLLC